MATRDQLEILVRLSHPKILEAFSILRGEPVFFNPTAYHESYRALLVFYGPSSSARALEHWMFGCDPIVAIASKSSLPTIEEAYEEYVRLQTFPA